MNPDPLGSFRDHLVEGVGGEARRVRRRRTVAVVVTLVVALGAGAAVAATRPDHGVEVAVGDSTTTAPSVDGDCPVTVPPSPGLAAPEGWPTHPPDGVWFGTDDLWTQLPTDGSSPSPRKSVWWSASFPGGSAEPTPEITVTWLRLDDASAEPLREERGTNAYTPGEGWFMIAGIDPPGVGCWKVTATYKRHQLSYVYEVLPRLFLKPEPQPIGMQAEVTGRVTFDPRLNCYLLDRGDERYPIVWPFGTTASDDGREITLPDGPVTRVGGGIDGGGGYVPAAQSDAGIPPACWPPDGSSVVLSDGQIEVTP